MSQIPIFPLRVALFPGVSLPLRIFEQRYLRLVADSLKADGGFGVVLIRTGAEVGRSDVWPVGVFVKIVDWSQGEEGLLHIMVQGQRRFRIESTSRSEDGLMMAEVQWLPEESSRPVPAECDGLLAVLDELKEHAAMLSLRFEPVESADALSWQLAQLLPLDDKIRIELLSTEDPLERLATIAASLDRWAKQ
ncbi:LON peptidase substrate-binding domain-containing protein [Microbulbifer guangxiensis]|uniref:LON peptidase substrate-binding domain-containing protein n=1 Tax=Microbulbifer guangxiensis TaxID=2904249 RepID=UPI001F3FB32F